MLRPRAVERRGAAACSTALPAAVFIIAWLTARAAPPESPAGFVGWPRAQVEIRSAGGAAQRLNATVADTPARQEQGLMFVRALEADESMWFPQERPRLMQMWMKNTLIPLDMLFVDARGRIACIAGRTTPQSLALISCPVAVSGVLEIGAGESGRRGIVIGDRLELGPKAYRPGVLSEPAGP